MAAVALVSLLAAIAAPFIRPLQSDGLLWFCVGILIQVGFAVGVAISKIRTRRKLIRSLGERIAVGHCSRIRWKHWPILKNLIALVFCSVLLLLSALCCAGVSWGALDPLWTRFESSPIPIYIGFIFIWWRLIGMSTGEQYMVCVWRVYPEAIEFFENRLVSWGFNLHEWRQVDLRQSQVFKDRFVVVLR